MVSLKSLSLLAAFSSVAFTAAVPEAAEEWHQVMLKRQAPGTPAYACHSACGTAITLSRSPTPCTNNEFLADYASCLACAGPSNQNIWRYYGTTLSAAGTKCGLSVTPAEGAASTTSSASVEPTTSTSAAPTTSSTAASTASASTEPTTSTSAVPETTSTTAVAATSTASVETSASTVTSSSSASAVAETYTPATSTPATTSIVSYATKPTVSSTGSPTQSAGNSTMTTLPVFAGAAHRNVAGAFVVVVGAVGAVLL